MTTRFELEPMHPDDWDEVSRIYAEGIRTGEATFETDVPSWGRWNESHMAECRFLARRDGRTAGWAALSPVSDRCVYAGVAEVSIYIGDDFRGMGLGHILMEKLVAAAEDAGLWTLTAGIFPENEASVRLHRKHGFRIVGHRERLGKLKGRWRDVLLLERRSRIVGAD